MCTPNLYSIAFIIFDAVLFLFLAWKTNLIRDSVTDLDFFKKEAEKDSRYKNMEVVNIPKPFSWANTQMGIWTVIISSCYIYLIFSCSCTFSTINQTALLLMGISVITTISANVIDNSQANNQRHQNGPSKGFFVDIFSDENGVSVHRFQNVLWTLVAIMIYVFKIHNYQCTGKDDMPELDGTLIALTGISSAAYLGVKMNENKSTDKPNTP